MHMLVGSFGASETIVIGRNIEVLGRETFSYSPITSCLFESRSTLIRIESKAFDSSQLQSLTISQSVEGLGHDCFRFSGSLSSISFERKSRVE
jgi:hypothetical protein